jgi:hypothetical protein
MRRIVVVLVSAATFAMVVALPAQADRSYHSGHYALSPIGGTPLRSGFVENIHANGPNVYAHEQYVINGAEPRSSYQVVLLVFPGDPTCSGNPITIPSEVINTNAAGNGTAFHVFTPADADGLRGLTLGGIWVLTQGTTARYATECAAVHLD